MSERDNGGPAFACAAENGHQPGMSLRDWFAGQALLGVAHDLTIECADYRRAVSERAYRVADAMLAARREEPPA